MAKRGKIRRMLQVIGMPPTEQDPCERLRSGSASLEALLSAHGRALAGGASRAAAQ